MRSIVASCLVDRTAQASANVADRTVATGVFGAASTFCRHEEGSVLAATGVIVQVDGVLNEDSREVGLMSLADTHAKILA